MLVLIPLQRHALITVCLWIKAPWLLLGVKPLPSLAMPMWPSETHAGFWHTASSQCTTLTGDSYGAGCWPCQGETASTAAAAPFGHHPIAVGHGLPKAPGPAPLSVPQLCCPGWARGSVCSPGALGSALLKQRARSGSLRGHTATPSTGLPLRGVQSCCHGDPQWEPSPCACWTTLCRGLTHPAPHLDTGSSPDNTLLHTVNTLPKRRISRPPQHGTGLAPGRGCSMALQRPAAPEAHLPVPAYFWGPPSTRGTSDRSRGAQGGDGEPGVGLGAGSGERRGAGDGGRGGVRR